MNNNMRTKAGEMADSLDTVAKQVQARMENEQRRFKDMYGVDPYNQEHYDLVIDTSRHSPQTVALTIFDTYRRWLKTTIWKKEKSAIPLGFSFKNQYKKRPGSLKGAGLFLWLLNLLDCWYDFYSCLG